MKFLMRILLLGATWWMASGGLARGLGWKADSHEQWRESLLGANPQPVDTLSVHIYHPRTNGQVDPGQGPAGTSLDEQFRQLGEAAATSGKPVWLGEFGPGIDEQDLAERRRQVGEINRRYY